MEDLRRYIVNEAELGEYTIIENFSLLELIKAQADVDSLMSTFYEGSNRPFLFHRDFFSDEETTLSSTNALISDSSQPNGFYDNTVLEILSGTNKGLRKYVTRSTLSGGTNVLTFADEEVGLSGNESVKIYQLAKFPRLQDTTQINSAYYKSIPEFIKQAVAFQYSYRISNSSSDESNSNLKSYSVAGDSFSKVLKGVNEVTSINHSISPQAYNILQANGVLTQSV